jgi:glutamate--cysteine ligase
MPTRQPTLTRDDAHRAVASLGFDRPPTVPGPDRQVGIELEWLTVDAADPSRPAAADAVEAAVGALDGLPGGGRVTFEPGGQVELSSPPLPLSDTCRHAAGDAQVLGDALRRAGVSLVALGLEPGPRRERTQHSPRYDAMEAYFDVANGAGRTMMRSTAALQVNLDLGDGADVERRWEAAHDLGPVLAAAFANSAIGDDGPTGFRSTRLAVWGDIDPYRTAPPAVRRDCRAAWAEYALAAPVMLVRTSPQQHVPVLTPLSFDEWIDQGHALGWPTLDDLEYHLTTLFPPVRPRGWLELRMIDAVPDPWWRAAVAVSAVLVQHPELVDELQPALEPVCCRWQDAARHGLSDPCFAMAARACFETALGVLPDAGADADTIAATEEFVERYVSRGRCPADDRLDAWRAGASVFPPADNAGAPVATAASAPTTAPIGGAWT